MSSHNAHETKLDGIEDGAEVNVTVLIGMKPDVQLLMHLSRTNLHLFSGSYNDLTDRPNIADALTEDDIYDFNIDIISEGSGITIDDNDTNNTITISVTNEFTLRHTKLKLDGIADGAEVNVQSDWDEVDINSDAFIQNKPTLFSGSYNDLSDTPSIPDEDEIYEYTSRLSLQMEQELPLMMMTQVIQ